MTTLITSLGMLSAVGHDVVTACAALRAGLTFPEDVDYIQILDEEEDEPTPLKGHPIRDYTEGFHMFGLWIRMAIGCLEDLVQYGNLPPSADIGFWRRTGMMLAVPSLDEARFQLDRPIALAEMKERYGDRLLGLFGVPIDPEHLDVVDAGHAGAAAAVERAATIIDSRRLDRAIVLAADSYLDPLTLEWLSERDRLKTPESPTGLAPGEGGACFLLESEAAAKARGATAHAALVGAATSPAPTGQTAGPASHGVALSMVVDRVLHGQASFTGELVSDLNGEEWRAHALAGARTRLAGRLSNAVRFTFPAASLGDTGAASGAIAVCVAVRSFARGYHRGGHALAVSISENGHVGAIHLERR